MSLGLWGMGRRGGIDGVWGGGRVLGLEKGTDCGPTAAELWMSRPKMAKKKRGGGAVLLLYCINIRNTEAAVRGYKYGPQP